MDEDRIVEVFKAMSLDTQEKRDSVLFKDCLQVPDVPVVAQETHLSNASDGASESTSA